MEELKPCRKCGGEAELKDEYDTLQIVCKTCGYEGKKYFGDYYDEGFMLQTYGDSAVKEWNEEMRDDKCLTCKKHYSQGGKCSSLKKNCLLYEEEPRGKMIRTNITFDIDVEGPCSLFIKFGEKVIIEDGSRDIELTCIKINWINLKTRECNITVDYHENEMPKFVKKRMFKVIK